MTLEKQIQSKRAYTQVYEISTINLIKEISICTECSQLENFITIKLTKNGKLNPANGEQNK
jgi:hypothetical protein